MIVTLTTKVNVTLEWEHQRRTEETYIPAYVNCGGTSLMKDEEGKALFKHKEVVIPRGGATTCFFTVTGDTQELFVGKARCSKKDNYERKLGRKLSFERAMRQSKLSKDEKTELVLHLLRGRLI